MTRDEYIKAIDLLNLWARAYYMYNKPLVTDEEYDNLYNKVLEYESQHPNFIESYSQTQKIGRAISDGFEKLAHINQMWSMEDIFNDDELISWLKRGEKSGFEFYCEPKLKLVFELFLLYLPW